MVNLFETMMNAQNGSAADLLANQFGMDRNQVETAMAALMPAFSQGFKRNASDPIGLGNWMQALSSGQHAKYYDDMTQAFQPTGIDEGKGILGHLFGSKDVSRAVAQQASAATGIGQDILKQMLPVIASTLMGGMFKQMSGQGAPTPQAASGAQSNVFGQIMEQMMAQSGMAGQTVNRAPNPMDNPFGKVLEGLFGGGAASTSPTREPRDYIPKSMDPSTNPWGEILTEMMSGHSAKAPEPQREKTAYDELFGEMFDAGRKSQEQFQGQYQRSMEQVFDQYMKGMDSIYKRR